MMKRLFLMTPVTDMTGVLYRKTSVSEVKNLSPHLIGFEKDQKFESIRKSLQKLTICHAVYRLKNKTPHYIGWFDPKNRTFVAEVAEKFTI